MKATITIEDTQDGAHCTTVVKCDPPTALDALPVESSSAAILTAMIIRVLRDVKELEQEEVSRS